MRNNPPPELRDQIAETVAKCGAFSIYMTIFADDSETREAILDHYRKAEWHTRETCFDADANVVPDRNV